MERGALRVCVITGASKGIGKAMLERFKREGFFTVNISRSESTGADLNVKADLSIKEQREGLIEGILQKTERIDVLINNAGIGIYENWENMKEDELKKVFELNFFAPVDLTRQAVSFLKESKGAVINVSSVAGKLYVPYMGGYCATKYSLNAFSDSLRAELKPYSVNVLNLIVGRINTGFSSRALGSKRPPETPFTGSAEKLADLTYRAFVKRKREVVYPAWYRLFIALAKTFPNVYDTLALKSWKS